MRDKSIPEIAQALNISTSLVKTLLKEGLPRDKAPGAKGKITMDLAEVRQWIKTTGRNLRNGGDRRSPASRARSSDGTGNPVGRPRKALTEIEIQHAEAKRRKDLAAAEKAELELAKMQNELLDAEDVAAAMVARVVRAKAVLMSIPSSLGADLVGLEQPEIERLLKERIYLALEELARDTSEDDE